LDKNLSDFVELPARRFQETQKSPPMFCTKCQEIRGVDDEDRTVMSSTPERLYWNSFEMCGQCYLFLRDYPLDVEVNRKSYQQKIKVKEEQIQKEIESRKFRVCFVEKSDKLLNSDFINSISKVKFRRYPQEIIDECKDFNRCPTFNDWCNCKGLLITKSKELVSEEIAKDVVIFIKSKGIYSWFEKE